MSKIITFFRTCLLSMTVVITVWLCPVSVSAETQSTSDTIDVLHYRIDLRLVNLSYHQIWGSTTLRITPKMNNISSFKLDLLKMNIDTIFYNNTPITSYVYNDTALRVTLPSPANQSDTFFIKVSYHGQPQIDPSGWGGFYFSSDSSFAYNLGVGFESDPHNYGRVWFPCIDDFTDRALYDCYITVKENRFAVCGGTLQSDINNGDGTRTCHWKLNNSIPTYLASVAAGNYAAVSDTFAGMSGNIPITLYVRPSDTNKAKNSFIHLPDILTIFENRFGPYRLERVGYVGVPFNSGAMEHATNIAYPNACIDGTLTYEDLYAHELAHMWFGDPTTCSSALDMWINEGWASYCEAIFKEGLYGKAAYKTHVRNNHKEVLQYAHVTDGSYMAVYGIPHEYTYGTTVYDKGADMVHTLRGYLGDSLFFSSVQALLSVYAFKDISTAEMRDFFTAQTGTDMTSFFDAWIFSPGFPHFSVDSFNVTQGPLPEADVEVFFRQKRNHTPAFANNNILEVTFMKNDWQEFTDTVSFSGVSGTKVFHVPFVPDLVMLDKEEKISDATTDLYQKIKSAVLYDFPTTYFQADVEFVSDSALLRVEHNWVAPDPLKTPNPDIIRLSDYRYWKVDGIFPPGFKTSGKFRYHRTGYYLDNVLLPSSSSTDSLLLLYREGPWDEWEVEPFVRAGTLSTGNLITDSLKRGEYTLAVGTPWAMNIEEKPNRTGGELQVFPNPSNTSFTFNINATTNCRLSVFTLSGAEIFRNSLPSGGSSFNWAPLSDSDSSFLVQLTDNNGRLIDEKKIVYVR